MVTDAPQIHGPLSTDVEIVRKLLTKLDAGKFIVLDDHEFGETLEAFERMANRLCGFEAFLDETADRVGQLADDLARHRSSRLIVPMGIHESMEDFGARIRLSEKVRHNQKQRLQELRDMKP